MFRKTIESFRFDSPPPLFSLGFFFFFFDLWRFTMGGKTRICKKKMNTRFLKMLLACEESLCKRKGAFPRSCRRNKTVYFDDDGK